MGMSYSPECSQVLIAAANFAKATGGLLGTEHMIAGMLETESSYGGMILRNAGVSLNKYVQLTMNVGNPKMGYSLSRRMEAILTTSAKVANHFKQKSITSDVVLTSILEVKDCYGVQALREMGINFKEVVSNIALLIKERSAHNDSFEGLNFLNDTDITSEMLEDYNEPNDGDESILEKYGQNLTKKAKNGKIDPVIGRKDEVDRIIQILSRRTKNNPVLIGEPGVGKSAIVEGLAQAIVNDDVPTILKNKTIFSLDLTSMIAGTKYRGEFEERINKVIECVKKNKDIILFIDEIHMIVGAGETSEGSMDAANILKPQLARGELQTIGATTIAEYRKYIEKDAALERRFQPIMVDPPSVEDTITILKGIREKYEKHHSVEITDAAIEAAAKLSDRYISDRFLPDKAIDLIDEAASKKHIGACVIPKSISDLEETIRKLNIEKESASKVEDYEKANELKNKIIELQKEYDKCKKEWKEKEKLEKLVLTEEDVAEIVGKWTKIPVVKLTQSEADVLLGIDDILRKRVVGQDEAINAVARAVRRARVGIKDPKRPIGSFLFLGPTGVGKTELSKALAEAMFGDENQIIRIDMSEYMDRAAVSKFTGSAPGYVGYEEGGQLTEKVRKNPYSVILFDEIEKAHPDVFNVLLQILEDGRLTDGHGRVVNFKNTIIILTSNIGAQDIKKSSVGFSESSSIMDYEAMKERQLAVLKNTLKPELINRIDDIIVFRSFNDEDVMNIAKMMGATLTKRLKERGIDVQIQEEAYELIIKKGYDVEYGARPLRRAIQSMVEDEIATRMLKGEFAMGDSIVVGKDEDNLCFSKK